MDMDSIAMIRKKIRSTWWNHYACQGWAGMPDLMRLMGRHRLFGLATSHGGVAAGAVAALSLELEAAEWTAPSDALVSFPRAKLAGCRLHIPLQAGYLVVIALNCAAGVALVEFAGQVSGRA